jgi:hypothetical protein
MIEKTDDNLLIVKSSDMGVVIQMGLYQTKAEEGQVESLVELTPLYRPSSTPNETEIVTNLYLRLLKEFVEKGYEGFINFLKSPVLDADTGLIDKILVSRLNEIYKYIVTGKKSISIGSVLMDFEDLYALKDKVEEVSIGLDIFANWLKTQKVLYGEELQSALKQCDIDPNIKGRFKNFDLVLFPILNCADIAFYRDPTFNRKVDLMEEIIKSEKVTLTEAKEPVLYKQLNGYYANKDNFFNILREMYIYTWSPYDSFLGGLFKFKVYKTTSDTFTIVSCRTY